MSIPNNSKSNWILWKISNFKNKTEIFAASIFENFKISQCRLLHQKGFDYEKI